MNFKIGGVLAGALLLFCPPPASSENRFQYLYRIRSIAMGGRGKP